MKFRLDAPLRVLSKFVQISLISPIFSDLCKLAFGRTFDLSINFSNYISIDFKLSVYVSWDVIFVMCENKGVAFVH